jgi:hypothetical protein
MAWNEHVAHLGLMRGTLVAHPGSALRDAHQDSPQSRRKV